MTGPAHRVRSTRLPWLAGILFPPAAIWIIWRRRAFSVGLRLLVSTALLIGMLVYVAAVIGILHYAFGLTYEFRGGYVPRLTFRRTLPNYEALEKSRKRPSSVPAVPEITITNSFWNGFRGLHRDGIHNANIRTNWPSDGLKPLWRQPCGGGYASFAVAGDAAFTIEQRRENETVVAYDIRTGAELWTCSWPAEFTEALGGDGPRATPAYDDGHVYALGALGEFQCIDAHSGKQLWRKNIVTENEAHQLTYGMAASPLIAGSNVIVTAGGHQGRCVVAYDKLTGTPAWHALDDSTAYSSPMLADIAGGTQLLVVTKDRAVGLEPGTGKFLWAFPWVVLHGNRNIAQPIVAGTNRIFLSAGYGTGCVLIEIGPGASGLEAREIWRNRNMKNKFTSSVLWESCIYGLDEDILTCIDAVTGQRRWKGDRYGYGQIILASGQLIILCGNGEIAVVKASADEPLELTRFSAITGKTWNHPAIASKRLLVRNAAEMACFDLR